MSAAATIAINQQSMEFTAAELGAMKSTIDGLAYSRNKSEQNKTAKVIVAFLSNMARVRGGKAMNNVKLQSYAVTYDLATDELRYTLFYTEGASAAAAAEKAGKGISAGDL